MAERNEETRVDRPDAGPSDQGAGPDAPPSNSIQEEVETAASPEGAGETTPQAEEAPRQRASKGGPTRREKLEARRAERRAAAGRRKPRTPEERAAERAERRAKTARDRRAYRAKAKGKRAEARKSAPPREADHAPEHGPGRAKTRQGVVISDKADKTITVRIDLVRSHKRYHKILRSTVSLHAHDERNDAHEGDTVRLVECRPMSRTKRWRLVEILERAR
jgi:small subunit ribosomal protein S17